MAAARASISWQAWRSDFCWANACVSCDQLAGAVLEHGRLLGGEEVRRGLALRIRRLQRNEHAVRVHQVVDKLQGLDRLRLGERVLPLAPGGRIRRGID